MINRVRSNAIDKEVNILGKIYDVNIYYILIILEIFISYFILEVILKSMNDFNNLKDF